MEVKVRHKLSSTTSPHGPSSAFRMKQEPKRGHWLVFAAIIHFLLDCAKMHWASLPVLAVLNVLPAFAQDGGSTFSKSSNDSLLWGPYRSNLYFGVRPRLPKSITTGLLWSRVEDYTDVQNKIRYTCEQNEDMAGYGWDKYDPRTGGVQTVYDKGNGIDLETSFVKFAEGRGGWGARVKGTVRDDAEASSAAPGDVTANLKTSVWFTVGMEGLGSLEVLGAEEAQDIGFDRNVVINGETTDLGQFRLTINDPVDGNEHPHHNHHAWHSKPLDHTFVHSVQVPDEALWQSKRTSSTVIIVTTSHADIDLKSFYSTYLQFHKDDNRGVR